MLDFLSSPVSFLLWCWHALFGSLFGDATFAAWALAIVFLVFTVRALLLRPAIGQARFARRMGEVAPRVKEVQRKYADDQTRLATEMRKVLQEHEVNPLAGYLSMLVQVPVFIGLNHVLRTLDTPSYLQAKVVGVHLGDSLVATWQAAPVVIPLILVAAVATHLTARLAATEKATTMTKVVMYVVPLGVLAFGAWLPLGLLVYWVSSNVWTLAQQRWLARRLPRPPAVPER